MAGEAEMPALPKFESYPGTAGRGTPAQIRQGTHISYEKQQDEESKSITDE